MIDWLEKHLVSCFFKSHFGVDCPGCGLQRSFIALLKGDLIGSLNYHIGLIPLIITVLLLITQLIIKHEKGSYWIMWSLIITTTITFIQFIARHILVFQNH